MTFSSVRAAFDSIREHSSRSVLSGVGIMVGSLAVMLLISIAQGVRDDVRKQVDELGANLIIVLPGKVDTQGFLGSGNLGISPFTMKDVDGLRGARGIRHVCRWTFVGGTVAANGKSPISFSLGTDPIWFQIRPHTFLEGHAFSGPNAREVVIGPIPKREMFGDQPAVGKTLKVNGVDFTIVGVTNESASTTLFGRNPFENVCYIPFDAVRNTIARGRFQIDRIILQADSSIKPESLVAGIKASVLKTQNGNETFTVLTQEDLRRVIYKVLNLLTYLVVGISTIAMFVGGVGIMTVMLMNVNERRREIGIRKTVGARRMDVFVQFLTESSILTLGGGVAGLILTRIAIAIIMSLTDLRPMLSWDVILLGLGMSFLVGTVFGLVPAIRASLKDPVESMRQE